MKVNLTGIPETLFITLRIRAIETKRPDAMVKDPYAVEILEQIEFDESPKNKISVASQTGTIARTLILDKIVNDFLSKNPTGIIANLGCGLDARCKRLSLNYCQWFDIDVEEAIDLRKLFFNENETSSYKMIAKSMFDYSWMNVVPKDKPILFIAEGVMMYFEEKEIKALFCEIAQNFVHAEIAFDALSQWAAKNHKRHPDVKKYNIPFKWGVDNCKEIENWHMGIQMIKEYYYMDYLKNRWPFIFKIIVKIYPSFMRAFRVLHIKLH
jgi:O-methyltransferase involved in polyketide biosynthesis